MCVKNILNYNGSKTMNNQFRNTKSRGHLSGAVSWNSNDNDQALFSLPSLGISHCSVLLFDGFTLKELESLPSSDTVQILLTLSSTRGEPTASLSPDLYQALKSKLAAHLTFICTIKLKKLSLEMEGSTRQEKQLTLSEKQDTEKSSRNPRHLHGIVEIKRTKVTI